MYRDSSHRNNWRTFQDCHDLHGGAIFSEWTHSRMNGATARLGLFMSLQQSWVGRQMLGHQYYHHVWAAGVRPSRHHAGRICLYGIQAGL